MDSETCPVINWNDLESPPVEKKVEKKPKVKKVVKTVIPKKIAQQELTKEEIRNKEIESDMNACRDTFI